MAAPGANVNANETTNSTKAHQDPAMADQVADGAAVDGVTEPTKDVPKVSDKEGKENDEPDLVAQALDTVEKEVDARQAKHAEEACLREVSPAISEGSIDGESSSGQNGAAEKVVAVAQPTSKKTKKKEDKSIEHILKALNSLETPEEKLAALCKKYADLHEEHRQMKLKFKQGQHKLTGILREKDQLQTEHSKAILAKSKLESLCRELQRHNKLIKDESYARAREEEEKRKEVTNKFQQTINDIQQQMNDHYTKNAKLREENVDLANKLKSLIEQYEQREQHIEKVLKHKELEQQLVDARLQQAYLKISEEKERSTQEKQILLTEAAEANKKVQLLEEQEKALRAQVGLYTEKYEEFQQTLSKSNEVFSSFKIEMDKMTKKIKKLEKETHMWKQRWENSNRALAQMADEKTKNDKENALLMSKVKKLESLCRALQQERNKGSQATEAAEAVGSAETAAEAADQPDSPAGEPTADATPETQPEVGAADSSTSPEGEPPAAAVEEVAPPCVKEVQPPISAPPSETDGSQGAEGGEGTGEGSQSTEAAVKE